MHKLSKLKEEQEAKSMKAHEENICKIKELEQAKALQNLLLAQKEELEAKNKEIIACLKKQKVLQDSLRQTSIYHFFHLACTKADSKITEEKWS